jgi:hypothetical protein
VSYRKKQVDAIMDRIGGIAVHALDGILSAPQLAMAPAETQGILVVKPGHSL